MTRRFGTTTTTAALLLVSFATAGRAEAEAQLSLEPRWIGGAANIAFRPEPKATWWLGVELGIGPDIGSRQVVGGSHFADDQIGLAYQTKDGATNKELLELVELELFGRIEPRPWLQIDTGLHLSVFLHGDSSDDDPGGGFYKAAFADVMVGWRRIKFGPRIMVGHAGEQDVGELVVHVVPLSVRVTFRF